MWIDGFKKVEDRLLFDVEFAVQELCEIECFSAGPYFYMCETWMNQIVIGCFLTSAAHYLLQCFRINLNIYNIHLDVILTHWTRRTQWRKSTFFNHWLSPISETPTEDHEVPNSEWTRYGGRPLGGGGGASYLSTSADLVCQESGVAEVETMFVSLSTHQYSTSRTIQPSD